MEAVAALGHKHASSSVSQLGMRPLQSSPYPNLPRSHVPKACPSLSRFKACPWAPGPCSQTVIGILKHSGSLQYDRREMVAAPDGVELLLDWKERPDTPADAPLLLILHGIGG